MTTPHWAAAIAEATKTLRTAGVPDAATDARVLAMDVLGTDRTGLISALRDPVSQAQAAKLRGRVAARASGMPISRLRGWREFWSLPLALSAATLDPRPDTETVVTATLEVLSDPEGAYRLCDLGTGSGAIVLALLSERPHAWGLGTDRSPQALQQAQTNARQLQLARRCAFVAGDWAAPIADSAGFDAIVSNPPYIERAAIAGLDREVRDHDPVAALDGGEDGLDAYRVLAADTLPALRPGGWLVLEIGHAQSEAVSTLLTAVGWRLDAVLSDLSGIKRVIRAQKKFGV